METSRQSVDMARSGDALPVGRSRMGRDSLTPRRRNRSGYFRMWRRLGRWEMWQLRAGEPERASQPWASRIWQRRRPWGLYPAFRSMRRRSAGHRYVKVVVANAWSVRENEPAPRSRDRCDVVTDDGCCVRTTHKREISSKANRFTLPQWWRSYDLCGHKRVYKRPFLHYLQQLVSSTYEFSLKVLSSLPNIFQPVGVRLKNRLGVFGFYKKIRSFLSYSTCRLH